MSDRLIHWFDIPVTDMDRAGEFYRTVLGVRTTRHEFPPDIVMEWFDTDTPHGGGGLLQGNDRTPSSDGTVVYFNGGDDLQVALDRVEPAGGTIVVPKSGNEEWGYVAFFLDPDGNTIGLQSAG